MRISISKCSLPVFPAATFLLYCTQPNVINLKVGSSKTIQSLKLDLMKPPLQYISEAT